MRTGLLKFIKELSEWRDMRFPEPAELDPALEGTAHIRAHVAFIIMEIYKLRQSVNVYWGEAGESIRE